MSEGEEAIAAGLGRALARQLGAGTRVGGLTRLAGGSSCEVWAFEAVAAGERQALVLRRDRDGKASREALPGIDFGPAMDRDTEGRIQAAAGAAGVPVPEVRFALEPADGLGAGYVMARIAGETIARRILRDDAHAEARPRLAGQCGAVLARIHGTELQTLPTLADLPPGVQLAQYRTLLDRLGEPHPVFELALRWLEANLPPTRPPTLVHGDFRNGNFSVGPEGLEAVLDWELAHLGDPMEDLGWLCVKSWRYGVNDRPVGGFGDRAELFAAYEAAGGAPVDARTVTFFEVFGTLRWGEICLYQAHRHLSGLHRSVELAAVGRRASETEYDLLELIG